MLVEVRPLPSNKWHGKKGKESFTNAKDIEVLYDKETGKYATGLTDDEAKEWSKELGVDLSNTFNPNEAHPFWSTKAATIRLPNHTRIFDTDKPYERIMVKNMKASKFVANSMKEWEEGKWPDATHVIFDEAEEVEIKANKISLRNQAVLILDKMTANDKANIIQILSNKTVKGRSDDFINVEIDSIINEKPGEFLKYVKMGKEEVYIRASVLEGISKNILTKEAGSVYYMGELIGMDYEDAVDWFKNPQNSKMKVSILEKLNIKA